MIAIGAALGSLPGNVATTFIAPEDFLAASMVRVPRLPALAASDNPAESGPETWRTGSDNGVPMR